MAAATDSIPFSVDGKTALVTGAGSGINYCFAKLLLSRGCNVVIADLGLRPEAQKLVDDYSSTDGGKPRAVFVKTDVVQWPDLDNMFAVADETFGGADIVCPGAGIFEPHWTNFWHPPGTPKSKDSAHPADGLGHYALFDINVTHPIRCTQLAISRWLNPPKDSKVGKASATNPKRIVHISSIAGQTPSFSTPLYIASKHAISGFIRSLAQLDTLGIRVNGVAPGIIKTPLWTDHPEKLQMFDSAQDDWVEPSEVAEAMLRCCEDDTVVGGWVMEVGKGQTRNVGWRNDPGPSGPGMSVGNSAAMVAETYKWLGEPGWGVVGK
ncbi:hypothetical protein B0A55_09108 [Friedmanniomyces simplex]|uniref:3-hydroxybutyrate dehydrogenase type 2 n=1 Tax=Friedmanniomyces simplex TaxID=329884 RepID=A0A4U0WTF3_9PEZI|nr:hypothetical protein B0A55_09108 [Friedmanniomyces simplex]